MQVCTAARRAASMAPAPSNRRRSLSICTRSPNGIGPFIALTRARRSDWNLECDRCCVPPSQCHRGGMAAMCKGSAPCRQYWRRYQNSQLANHKKRNGPIDRGDSSMRRAALKAITRRPPASPGFVSAARDAQRRVSLRNPSSPPPASAGCLS